MDVTKGRYGVIGRKPWRVGAPEIEVGADRFDTRNEAKPGAGKMIEKFQARQGEIDRSRNVPTLSCTMLGEDRGGYMTSVYGTQQPIRRDSAKDPITQPPMRADEANNDNGLVGGLEGVHAQRGRRLLDTLVELNIECNVEGKHGRIAKVGADTIARPYMDATMEVTVGNAGLDRAQGPGRTLDGAATGWSVHTKYPKMTRESDVKKRAPIEGGGKSVEDIGEMQVQHGSPGHEPVIEPMEVEGGLVMAGMQHGLPGHGSATEPVEVEGDTGIAVAMGLEPQVHPSETPEHERQRRRPKGGKQKNMSENQRKAYRNARNNNPG